MKLLAWARTVRSAYPQDDGVRFADGRSLVRLNAARKNLHSGEYKFCEASRTYTFSWADEGRKLVFA